MSVIRLMGAATVVVVFVLMSAGAAVALPVDHDPGGAPFVGVPDRYVYDPGRGALHDYCTKSADDFPADRPPDWPRELVADFRGPCARHDLCYEENPRSGKAVCDNALRDDLLTNCRYQYEYRTHHNDLMRRCEAAAHVMYDAVKRFGGG